jgi:hypothetical protein
MCGREPEGVCRDIEQRVEHLLRVHEALVGSTHIDAAYELTLVEQDLRSHGIDPSSASGRVMPARRTRQRFGGRG